MRELETHKPSPLLQHPESFPQGLFTSSDIAETEGDGIEIKAIVRERELFGVPLHPFKVRVDLGETGKDLFLGSDLPDFEHFGIDVTDGDGGGRGGMRRGVGFQGLLHEAEGNVARATSDV